MDSLHEMPEGPLDARDASRIGRAIEANDPMARHEDVLVAESSELDPMVLPRSGSRSRSRKAVVLIVGVCLTLGLLAIVLWATLFVV